MLYGLLLVVYPISQVVLNGHVLLTGQLWAELGYYYETTRSLPFLHQLMVTDAGYIPFPQRVIAGLGTALGVPPSSVPYVWSAIALVGSAALAGVLCLPSARPVIDNDGLRFAISLSILLVPDFNTKGFNNATYFGAVLCLLVAALGVVKHDRRIPRWAWVIPILMVSKPLLLVLLPLLIASAVVGRSRRMRAISAAAAATATVQVTSVLDNPGVVIPDPSLSALDRIGLSIWHTFGFIGRFTTSVSDTQGTTEIAWIGAAVVMSSLALCVATRHPASTLVVGGLYSVAATAATDVLSLSRYGFDSSGTRLTEPIPTALDRWFFGMEAGTMMVVGALIAIGWDLVVHGVRTRRTSLALTMRRYTAFATVGLFAVWFWSVGWVDRARAASTPPGAPITDVSQWQQLSDRIASDDSLLCVPLNSSWVVGRNCTTLVGLPIPEPSYISIVGYEQLAMVDSGFTNTLALPLQDKVTRGSLASIAVIVQPPSGDAVITGNLQLTLGDGTIVEMFAQADVPASGGLIQFVDRPARAYDDVVSATVRFDQPVGVARADVFWSPPGDIYVMWMGIPGEQ